MTDPIIGICPDRTVEGLRSLVEIAKALPLEALPLSQALEYAFATDAHLVCYYAVDETGEPRYLRVNKRSAALGEIRSAGGDVLTSILLFDYDLPGHRAWDDLAEVETFMARLGELAEVKVAPPTAFYTTRGGARLVYVLSSPVPCDKAEGLVAGLLRDWREVGIELDPACQDWSRLFRLPNVLRDGRQTSTQPWYVVVQGGPLLEPDAIKPAPVKIAQAYANVEQASGPMPTPEEVHDILYRVSKSGKETRSEWHSTARTWLQGRDPYEICFNHQQIDASRGRNNELTRLIGSAVGMLYSRDGASAASIYALFYDAVAQLEPDESTPDWHRVAWDITLRLWNAEASQQAAAIEEAVEAKLDAEDSIWPRILQKMRESYPNQSALKGEDHEATTWASGRLIAAGPKGGLFLMQPDGSYSSHPCSPELLHATIRHSGMEGVIETHEIKQRSLRARSAQDLLNAYAIPVQSIECTPCVPSTRIVERGSTKALVLKVHQLRSDLEPEYNEDVAQWIKQLGGRSHAELLEWLSHCLDVEHGICALALIGASGAGKGMIVQGIAECFEAPAINNERALGRFNMGLMHNPIIHLDEGIPSFGARDGGRTPDQIIRSIVSGGTVQIEPKGSETFLARIYPRVIISANNTGILAQLAGKSDLNDQDLCAIAQRLLYINVPETAAAWMTHRGNYRHTRGWVSGGDGNNYTLARHILYLFKHRKDAAHTTGRLLVEGTKTNSIVSEYALRTPAARAVVRTLLQMIEAPTMPSGMAVEDGELYVVPSGIVTHYETYLQVYMRQALGTKNVAQVLRLLAPSQQIPMPKSVGLAGKQRWWQIRLEPLIMEALSAGYNRRKLEELYARKHGQQALNELLVRLHDSRDND